MRISLLMIPAVQIAKCVIKNGGALPYITRALMHYYLFHDNEIGKLQKRNRFANLILGQVANS